MNDTVNKVSGKRLMNFIGGLESLIGQRVTLFCGVYIYTGTLVGVSEKDAMLEDAGIVYETGPFSDSKWKDMQKLPNAIYVRTSAIEMYTILK